MAVEVGDEAPDFELKDQNNQVVRLSSFRGEKNVVLVFYPATFTGVCQGELCSIRDDIADFATDDVQTLAVSCDSVFAQKVWSEQQGYTFPVLSDFWPHGAVAQAYGVFEERIGRALRGTFIVDKQGVVRYKVVHAVPDARNQDEYLEVLKTL